MRFQLRKIVTAMLSNFSKVVFSKFGNYILKGVGVKFSTYLRKRAVSRKTKSRQAKLYISR